MKFARENKNGLFCLFFVSCSCWIECNFYKELLMKLLHFLAFCLFAFGMSKATVVELPSYFDDYFEPDPVYAPKVVFCTKAPRTNDSSMVHKLEVVISDSTIPKISWDFKFPYIQKYLTIAGMEYSSHEILNKVDATRFRILQAMQRNMRSDGDTLWLDLRGIDKDSDFFSAINFKVKAGKDSVIKDIDLLTLDEKTCPVDSAFDLLGIEFKFKASDSVKVDLGKVSKISDVVATVIFEIQFKKSGDMRSMNTAFNFFRLEFPAVTPEDTKNWPLGIAGDRLIAYLTKDGVQTNIRLDEKIDAINMPLLVDFDVLDKFDIPFLEKNGFLIDDEPLSLGKIFRNINDYYKMTGSFVDNAIDDALKIPFKDVFAGFEKYANKRVVIDDIALLDKALPDTNAKYVDKHFVNLMNPSRADANKKIQLKNAKNVLVYKITLDSLKYSTGGKFDGFKVYGLDFDIVAYAKQVVYATKNNWIVWDDSYLDRIDLNFSADVPSLDIGLFKAKFGDGTQSKNAKLTYKVSVYPREKTGENVKASLELSCDSLTVLAGNMVMEKSKNRNKKERFSYDFENRKWILPNLLKRFSKYSSDDLLNHVFVALNAMRSVNGIAGTDVATKFEQLVFGDSLNNRKSEILKKDNGKFIKKFSDVSDFVRYYNYAWNNTFSDSKKKETDDACMLVFLDANKKEVVFKDRVSKSKVAYAKLVFRFDFNLRPDNRLEFVAALRKNLAELPSDAQVRVGFDSEVFLEWLVDLRR